MGLYSVIFINSIVSSVSWVRSKIYAARKYYIDTDSEESLLKSTNYGAQQLLTWTLFPKFPLASAYYSTQKFAIK